MPATCLILIIVEARVAPPAERLNNGERNRKPVEVERFVSGEGVEEWGRRIYWFLNQSSFFFAPFFLSSFFSPRRFQGFAGLSVLFCVLFCGYLIPGDDIPPWWIWIFHINPLTWAFRAAVLNEFQAPEYDVCATDDVPCPKALGQVRCR